VFPLAVVVVVYPIVGGSGLCKQSALHIKAVMDVSLPRVVLKAVL